MLVETNSYEVRRELVKAIEFIEVEYDDVDDMPSWAYETWVILNGLLENMSPTCSKYVADAVLPDENGNCSLCGSTINKYGECNGDKK